MSNQPSRLPPEFKLDRKPELTPLPVLLAAVAMLFAGIFGYTSEASYAATLAGACFVASGFTLMVPRLMRGVWESKFLTVFLLAATVGLGIVSYALFTAPTKGLLQLVFGCCFAVGFGQLLGLFTRLAIAGLRGELRE